MALVQDHKYLINHIRAQYLAIADDDQSRRIIRPYSVRNEDTSIIHPTQELSQEFTELLQRTESPPIPINVLEESQLMRKLHLSRESLNDRIDETDEEREPYETLKEQTLQAHNPDSKASLATLNANPAPANDSEDPLSPQISQVSKKLPSFANTKIGNYKPPFTKLFKNSTGNSSRQSSVSSKKKERKKPESDKEGSPDDTFEDDDDDDDDFDDENESYDESENFDDRTTTHSHTNTESDSVNFEDIEDNTASRGQDESGILVDQNYSDVNTASQVDRFNDSKYLYGDNSVSSVDDQLLLDSDFSDEDEDDIIDSALQSARLHMLQAKPPSSSTNRKLSFEKQLKPKLRPKRSSSLSAKIGESTPNDNYRHTRSNSSFLDADTTQSSIPEFGKMIVPQPPRLQSQLTALINKKSKQENSDPLEYYIFVSGDKISNRFDVINMTVYLPNSETLKLKIRKTVSVFETIGFILLKLSEQYPALLSTSLLKNPNKWCLKLVDDDGEPYEGSFGLMDRTKAISSYGEDEVALIEVNDSEFQINEIKTPLPVTENESGGSGTPSPSKTNMNKQTNYFKSIIPRIDNDIKDAATVTINIYKYPVTEESSYSALDFPLTAKLNEILLKYTKLKDLDPNDYQLKVIGEDYVLDLNDSVSSLDGSYKLEILTKRKVRELQLRKKKILDNNTLPTINSNLTPHGPMISNDLERPKVTETQEQPQQQQGTRPSIQRRHSLSTRQFSSSFSKHGISSSFKNKNSSRSSLKNNGSAIPPNIVTAEYQKFTVWRRLPMSFINRHERTLAIDGEYVYILPKDEKIWYENNFKTRTFHVSQIVSCKVSKRMPSNFKIVVMKTNGPKRYDFEALNPAESAEIINKLHKLMDAYKVYNSSFS